MCSETVRFVNLEGKLKQFRRQLSEIHFDVKPESVGKLASVASIEFLLTISLLEHAYIDDENKENDQFP